LLHGLTNPEPTDADLLGRFVAADDSAFTALMRRHGGLGQSVCRTILPCPADVEDAVQATFLVLARKANSLRRGLHGSQPSSNESTAKKS
jgi:RNA polymerase sigma-70 factor (ECF subfamily)